MSNGANETARLRRAFDALPKVPNHGADLEERHQVLWRRPVVEETIHRQREPLPKPTVVYTPESQILYLENGQVREDAAEMSRNVLVYYGKEQESEAVAIRIDCAEIVLKPFVDAILAKYGIKPETDTQIPERQAADD